MAKTKLEKIGGIDEQIEQLEKRKKLLRQQHNAQLRKERNHRICKRGAHLESILPETIILTDEGFNLFIEQVLTSKESRKLLTETIELYADSAVVKNEAETEQSGETAAPKPEESTTQTTVIDGQQSLESTPKTNHAPTQKPPQAAQSGKNHAPNDGRNSTRQGG